jgi:uncharacterized membrane protein (DUF485 family)
LEIAVVKNRPAERFSWWRLSILFLRLVIFVFLAALLQDWLSINLTGSAVFLSKGVGFICLVLVIYFVIVPVLDMFGIKTKEFTRRRRK